MAFGICSPKVIAIVPQVKGPKKKTTSDTYAPTANKVGKLS